jgi:hypothetical protein
MLGPNGRLARHIHAVFSARFFALFFALFAGRRCWI